MTDRPHDALFKRTFEDPEHAVGLLRDVLPATVSRAIVWSSLEREDGTFVDQQLTERHTDLLFTVRLESGGEALLYLLLEHQSSGDHDMPLRMLRYEVRIWERFRTEHPDMHALPPIIPIVISHEPSGWRTPMSFDEMFDPRTLAIAGLPDFVPRFHLLVDDLSAQSNADLKARTMSAFVKLVLWALRDARHSERFHANVDEWIAAFHEARRAPRGLQALTHLMRYFALVTEPAPFETFRAKLSERLSAPEEIDMTMSWFEHKQEQARAEGVAGALAATLRKLLALKFGAIDPEHEVRIANATPEALDRYLERILSATTVAGVFAE